MRTRTLLGLAALALAGAARGDDWPQWRGPNRDDVSKEKGLLQAWPKGGPALAWTFGDAGNGYGGPAVVGDRVYLLGSRKGEEMLIALDAKDGKEKWTAPIGKAWDFQGNNWSLGPNATPTVDGDLIYALGTQGLLVCADKAGKEVWRRDLVKELAAEVTQDGGGPQTYGWGFSWSPLVDGDKLIVTPGGKQGLFAALNKKDGKTLWQSKDVTFACSYASPVVAEIGGVRQYVTLAQEGAVGVDAASGALLWTAKPKRAFKDMVCTTPIVHDGHVFVTGTQSNGELFKVSKDGGKFKAESVWTTKALWNFHGGIVLLDKHLYGAHEARDWKCLDFATGEAKWASPANGVGPGSLTCADGRLYLYSQQDGTIGLIEASPAGYKEHGQFPIPKASAIRKPSGKFWTHPVVANGVLYIRDQDLLFAFKVK
jgi:outer membrane protein assembly factor BamB